MGFTNLWPLFLLLTIPPVIMLYILKRKYKEEVISSSLLWKEVYKILGPIHHGKNSRKI